MTPNVNTAMARNGPEKVAIRQKWLDLVQKMAEVDPGEDQPLYVTLPGPEALDIQMLIDAGVVQRTDNAKSILQSDQWKIAAVLDDVALRAKLLDEYPGLRVVRGKAEEVFSPDTDVIDELAEYSGVSPSRGRVINLDYNATVEATMTADGLECKLLEAIEALARTHAEEPQVDWYLCLTFNATIDWDADCEKHFKQLIADNCAKYDDFRDALEGLFGNALFGHFQSVDVHTPLSGQNTPARQKCLQAVVPKKVISDCYSRGWRITVEESLSYGSGQPGQQAPMVTWVFHFEANPANGGDEHEANYKDSLDTIVPSAGRIAANGDDRTPSIGPPRL